MISSVRQNKRTAKRQTFSDGCQRRQIVAE